MDVLISGAGIAGLTTAYWLHQRGITVTVVERADTIRDGGYKVDIRGTAVEVVRRMGLLDEVRGLRTEVREATFVDRDGATVATMDADLFGGRHDEDVEILRGDLARLLHERLLGKVEFVFGDSIVDIDAGGDGVRVAFEHGPERRFDHVVGA